MIRSGLLFGALAGCAPPGPQPDVPELALLSVNVGNLDEGLGGPCPADPYHGATCSVAEEQRIRASIDALSPDVVVLLEVLDATLCPEAAWVGEPDLACTGAPDRDPYQQARRMLGPDYAIACDGIAHYDCVGSRLPLDECGPGEDCIPGAETPPHPDACATNGGITSVSRVHATWDDAPFTLVVSHPLNGVDTAGDACRAAQTTQAFGLADGDTVLAGDWNFDPYRIHGFATNDAWDAGMGDRFTDHGLTEDPPPPTWLDLVALDHVVSDFLAGTCEVRTGDQRIDGGTLDHRALWCHLTRAP